jgi:hypothetical protein
MNAPQPTSLKAYIIDDSGPERTVFRLVGHAEVTYSRTGDLMAVNVFLSQPCEGRVHLGAAGLEDEAEAS